MEPWIWKQMLWTVGFLSATYLPLQCVVLWRSRGATRVAAALPLLVMVPMIVAGLRPDAYRSGSLYGMLFFCPYLPAMIYLVAVSCVGRASARTADTSCESDLFGQYARLTSVKSVANIGRRPLPHHRGQRSRRAGRFPVECRQRRSDA